MIEFPQIDPVIVRIGPLALRWYGLMYLLGFAGSFLLVRFRLNKERKVLPDEQVEDVYFYLILGLIVGARVGYMFFYNLPETIYDPISILYVWQGGMSFHGGLIGTVLAGIIYCRSRGISAMALGDILVITAPIGLGFGRLGNFINGELWGRVTDLPWGMVFPGAGPEPRHPSQLYELALEGFLLFAVLWFARKRLTKPGQMTALFLILYGILRSSVEFFRQPDPQLGYIFGFITMGQILSCLMILTGLYILIAYKPRGKG